MNHKLASICTLLASFAMHAANAQPTACEFTAPSLWVGRLTQWHGHCQNGLAQGPGVLRSSAASRSATEQVQLFFGEMNRGKPVLGVIATPGGFIAGKFKNGEIDKDSDRQDLINAFRVASSAAATESKRYSDGGNQASARFYAAQATQLSEQLD